MSTCPYCDYANIEGADVCEQCGQPLDDLHLPDPPALVERSLLADRVSVFDPKQVVTVAPDTPVAEVLQLLVRRRIGCVFVVQDEQLAGVFSERDALLRLGTAVKRHAQQPISQFMTSNPQSLDCSAKVAYAVHLMDVGGYRHVPLVDKDRRPVGVISARDILEYLTRRMRESDSADSTAEP